MCLLIRCLVSSMVSFVIVSVIFLQFLYKCLMLSLIKESLSECVNDDFWEIVEVTCKKKVESGVEL